MNQIPSWMLIVSEIAKWVTSLTAIIGIIIALIQLRRVKKTLEFTALNTVINIENELNKRKIDLENAKNLVIKLERKIDVSSEEIEEMHTIFIVYLENYLNVISRLCYCILTGYISEEQWKEEYHEFINDVVEPLKSGAETSQVLIRYQNILSVYYAWKKEPSSYKKRINKKKIGF